MDCSKNRQLHTTLHDELTACYTHPNRSVTFRTSFASETPDRVLEKRRQ
jgi:hypothetical protein